MSGFSAQFASKMPIEAEGGRLIGVQNALTIREENSVPKKGQRSGRVGDFTVDSRADGIARQSIHDKEDKLVTREPLTHLIS